MTLGRMIVMFVAALAVMLAVVILRAEATRVHHEIAELDRQDEVYRQQLRKEHLALQRARDPAVLRERVNQMQLGEREGGSTDAPSRTRRP